MKVKGDSELILKQMQGLYNVRSENLKPLYREAKEEEKRFYNVDYEWVSRDRNEVADSYAKRGANGSYKTDSY